MGWMKAMFLNGRTCLPAEQIINQGAITYTRVPHDVSIARGKAVVVVIHTPVNRAGV